MKKALNNKCKVLHVYNTVIHESKMGILYAPSIIVLNKSIPNKRLFVTPKYSRENILIRDNYTCQYCGVKRSSTKKLNLDHVIPKAQGGLSSWENIVTACLDCNNGKRDRTPEEAGMKLFKQPTKPKENSVKFYLRANNDSFPEEWKFYLGI